VRERTLFEHIFTRFLERKGRSRDAEYRGYREISLAEGKADVQTDIEEAICCERKIFKKSMNAE